MGQQSLTQTALSRREFIGAGAVAGAGVVAGPWAKVSVAAVAERPAMLPKYQIGFQCYTVRNPAAMGNGSPSQSNPEKTAFWLDTIIEQFDNLVVESYGNNYGSLSQAQWREAVVARGGYCWGDHNGGNLSSAAALEAAVARINNLGTREIGTASDGVVGVNAGGRYSAQNFLNAAENMNRWGQALQENGAPGARYYFHPHQQSYAVITDANNSGMPQYNGMRLMELMLQNLDPSYAFVQADLAWARHNAALNTNAEYLAFMARYQDQLEAYHVKGMSGTAEVDCIPNPADLVPWQDLFNSLAHPAAHTFLWERDGPGSGLSGDELLTSFQRFHDLLHNARLDRSVIGAPGNVTPPVLGGTAAVGSRLEVSDPGTWVRMPSAAFTYRWLRNELPIEGARARSYRVRPADAGQALACEVTARNNRGTTPENTTTVIVT
jgi:hypothetical protein